MRITTIFLLCFPLSGLSIPTEAQEALYVYGQGTCNAVDIRHVDEIRMTPETVDITVGVNYRCIDVDSITLREPEVDYGCIGWWGSLANGSSACYYQTFLKDCPDMVFEATDSIFTSAFFYLPDEEPLSGSRRRVGRKWRYVKNTLSGRRKFQIHPQQTETADTDVQNTQIDDNGRIYLDLSSLFEHCPTSEAKKAVNFWYHPQDTAIMPKTPLFGTMTERTTHDYNKIVNYDVTLHGIADNIRCHITFLTDHNGIVRGDSMRIEFPDSLTEGKEFELIDAGEDESTNVLIIDNVVYIYEVFEATIDDVMRWLTRFDLDVCKPIYIREEE